MRNRAMCPCNLYCDSESGPEQEEITQKSALRLAQQTGIREAVLHDGSESVEAKMNKIVVLSDDLSTRAREVEGV